MLVGAASGAFTSLFVLFLLLMKKGILEPCSHPAPPTLESTHAALLPRSPLAARSSHSREPRHGRRLRAALLLPILCLQQCRDRSPRGVQLSEHHQGRHHSAHHSHLIL